MSTFMAAAWVDLRPDADVEGALAVLHGITPKPEDIWGSLIDATGGPRVELGAFGVGYWELPGVVVEFLRTGEWGIRALIALDHDEFGVEHVVLDGQARRVHHVYVHPRNDETNEPYADVGSMLTEIPAAIAAEPSDDPGALINGPLARAAAAKLYDVPVERVETAALKAINAHEHLQVIGTPFEAWLDAFGLPWIGETDGRDVDL